MHIKQTSKNKNRTIREIVIRGRYQEEKNDGMGSENPHQRQHFVLFEEVS